ncbi:hypothetical protein HZB02_00825 [Candidatus Woesearchaeota archaeon]|nr:hypothetical protein [Candidatus Woesearchaeota archaeon]
MIYASMVTRKEQIVPKVIDLLRQNSEGVRYSEIVKRIKESFPEIPINTIHGTVWDLDVKRADEIYKADRGLFRHVSFRGKDESVKRKLPEKKDIVKEHEFYESFAKYLEGELDDCTTAISLGGNKFKDKWGTPDVIGKNESSRSDIIKHETEIVSAEIKIDDSGLITAFGQACAYKSFSHKVYIVIPKSASEEDKSRIESLSLIFGIGLILFDATNKEDPQFEIRVRPLKHEPDSFYVNKYMKLIETELFN